MQIRRLSFVVVVVAATAACGLSVVGSLEPAATDDGGAETGAALPETSTNGDSQVPIDLDAAGVSDADADAADGFVDYTALCNQECPDAGGTCDAGTCVHDCSAGNACSTAAVVCPPGVPCSVTCGSGACTMGVDCATAASCAIDCAGTNSCATNPVTCGGSKCSVTCEAGGSCAAGVFCDAGTCTLDCAGTNSCSNGVTCNAADCSIKCGNGGSCTGVVSCGATNHCSVECLGGNTCTGPFRVVAKTADVTCFGPGSCSNGVDITAGDASTNCVASNTCGQAVYFDGGHGTFNCVDSCNYCCAAGSTCTGTLNAQASCP